MVNFSYRNPTRIEFGRGKENEIGAYIAEEKVKKVLLTYGSDRIKRDGLFDVVVKSLEANGIEYVELGGIVSNPVLSKVYEAVELAKEECVEAILSVGGGSVLDSSKAIAAGTLYDGDVWDFFIGKGVIQKALPVYDIITLAATGSEMNTFAVVTNEATKQKYSIASPHLYPKVSVINPELQKSVSKEYLVYSAADIIAHSIEGYFTASSHPDIIATYIEANIATVMKTTETLLSDEDDYDARGEFAWAATQALNGTTYLGVEGYSFPNHMIEHTLSALFNVPHGAGLSVIMPAWMKWYVSPNEGQFKRFAQNLFGLSGAVEGIEALEAWFNKVGTPTKLSQLSIKESDLDAIVENACEHAGAFGLAEIYTKEVLKEILEKAL
ncbi:iron-containing alcohol dehydrogenase [Sulfurovum mangrovi]|uniref:iron-containing alcohol dehydrogenase n=1 Tax=Sulfurovum mangrovi TaxID=2893889 RepID=UPI001E5A0B3E|nr:iron-containing alcohol dehydrogenase [Sulfurovum mangrovi]UFH60523.1 iron-containing alcohol dehydrogenase [Sulfurovum mangrovi]